MSPVERRERAIRALRAAALAAERANHTWLANLCWAKVQEAQAPAGIVRRHVVRFDRTDARSIW